MMRKEIIYAAACQNIYVKYLQPLQVNEKIARLDLLSNEEKKIILEDVRKLNPQCTFPTIVIGDKVIVGFEEAKIRKALGL